MTRAWLAIVAVALLGGCSPRVPIAPTAARAQDPHACATGPWRARGRAELAGFGRRISVEFVLRADDGGARAVFLSDDGVLLADLAIGAAGLTVHRIVPALRPRAVYLAALVAPYARLPEPRRSWVRGVLRAETAHDVRRYGGDPLLLRRIDGPGWPVTVADHAAVAGGLVPRLVVAEGPLGAELRLRLVELAPLPR